MPYIAPARRPIIDNYLMALGRTGGDANLAADANPQDCGELNYAFTMTCLKYEALQFASLDWTLRKIAEDYLRDKPLRYQRVNDVAGAFTCAALELEDRCPTRKYQIATLRHAMSRPYQEFAVAYEKLKIIENGDIAEYGSPR